MKFDTQRLLVGLKYGPHDRQLVAVTIYAAPPCHRDPGRQAGKLLLFPPGPPDGQAQSLQARVDLRRRHVETLRRETGKRLLVQLGDLDTDSTDGEAKNLALSLLFLTKNINRSNSGPFC